MRIAAPQPQSQSESPSESQPGPRPADAVHVRRARCLDHADVFRHPLLEEPPNGGAAAAVRRPYGVLERQAADTCRSCPLLAPCLYDAVVRHDVAGYAGGTTARERAKIRALLGVTVEPENLDTLAGVTGGNRPVDHDEVLRLRTGNPDESLERLAQRLGCSLSTVKRHLRRERRGMGTTPISPRAVPTIGAVLAATRTVLHLGRGERRVAA